MKGGRVASSRGFRKAVRNGLKLTGVMGVAWLLAAGPAWALGGRDGLLLLSLAAAVCLIPGWLVFAFHSQYGTAAPPVAVLAAMVGRMFAVLCGAVAVKAVRPDLDMTSFALCLGVFYMLSLATETRLLLPPPARGTSAED